MEVLKVELEGTTCSFRYPHFIQGKQPTYEMPPLATIYGHISSAVGEWIDPNGLLIGYNFSYTKKGIDLEHIHLLEARMPTKKNPYVAEGNINPFKREFLFEPKLTLYINRAEYLECFLSPIYPVVLGRSQDLAYYKSVQIIQLEQDKDVYFENTLLPFSYHQNISRGIYALMPKFLDYENNRHPTFAPYIYLKEKISRETMCFVDEEPIFWVDKTEPSWENWPRGIYLHSLN